MPTSSNQPDDYTNLIQEWGSGWWAQPPYPLDLSTHPRQATLLDTNEKFAEPEVVQGTVNAFSGIQEPHIWDRPNAAPAADCWDDIFRGTDISAFAFLTAAVQDKESLNEQFSNTQYLDSPLPGFGAQAYETLVQRNDRALINAIAEYAPNITSTESLQYQTVPTGPIRRSFQCTVPDCPLGPGGAEEKTFKRNFELKRHVESMHEGGRKMACPAINCDKFNRSGKGSRKDKLMEHVRKVHGHNDAKFECPIPDCWLGNIAFLRQELMDHAAEHDEQTREEYKGEFGALAFRLHN